MHVPARVEKPGCAVSDGIRQVLSRHRLWFVDAIAWLVVPVMVTLFAAAVVGVRGRGLRSRRRVIADRAKQLQLIGNALAETNRAGGDERR